ncbi:hypothetical protein GCM10027275_11760 [Rhabdobacter roseus]|uniref:Lipoprotein n=1 Tax=Rhabdobacter roseus TaxID=1655419 RepID=A0A840TSW2_9BACT|nr:hypothetical protein [Rhabdobacter roseus]MBB5283088.1 hypothetical protein [Rhabdobacter roseus]
MKQILSLSIVLLGSLLACTTTTSDTQEPEEGTENIETFACYAYTQKQDTVSFRISIIGTLVVGDLEYRLSEKDRNEGLFQGTLSGDTLLGDYTFRSEGVLSVRQVAYLKKGKELLEGYGEVEEKAGKTVFKNRSTLRFGEGITLQEVDCE